VFPVPSGRQLLTKGRRIVINYHGIDVWMRIGGYIEEGSTTTPSDVMLRNNVSRYHFPTEVVRGAALVNERVALRAMELNGGLQLKIKEAQWVTYEIGTGTPSSIVNSSLRVGPEGTYGILKLA